MFLSNCDQAIRLKAMFLIVWRGAFRQFSGAMANLTSIQIGNLSKHGRYSDGDGVILVLALPWKTWPATPSAVVTTT
jgi:hypothetical protein